MKRNLFYVILVLFSLVWLGITGYTLFAMFIPTLPYSLSLFAFFLALLDISVIPVLWLCYRTYPKTIQLKVGVALTSVLFLFFWGPFSPVHEFLSLHVNDLQLRWVAFAYIWEVVLVGGFLVWVILRMTRSASLFVSGESDVMEHASMEKFHKRVSSMPFRASMVFVIIVLFGFSLGSIQLFYFSGLPFTEVVKNLMNGFIHGSLSAFVVFFLLERILEPALQKSGMYMHKQNGGMVSEQKRSSLFTKIYAVSSLLTFVVAASFLTLAYGRGQAILEEQLMERMRQELETARRGVQEFGPAILDAYRDQFGTRGIVVYTQSRESFFKELEDRGYVFSYESLHTPEPVFVDRRGNEKVVGVLPVGDEAVVAALLFVADFNDTLHSFLILSVFLLLVLAEVVAVIGTLFAYSIVRPVRIIREGSMRLGRGDFTEHIHVYTNDELEEVSAAFNEAAGKLRMSYEKLEEEVRARTSEIAKINKEQEAQIVELDTVSRRLVRRDFALRAANERLREIDRAKSQFVSIAAHQLRTPLSAIKWIFSMLLSGDFGKVSVSQRQAVERGRDSTDRLITLVSDLLNVARIEGGQIIYRFDPLRIEEVIGQVLDDMRPRAEAKGITLTIKKPPRALPEGRGDPEKMQLALQNIIENAVIYTPEGGSITIKIARKGRDHYQVIVTDTGIGIPKEQQSSLFEKFFRGSNVIRLQIQGTGLGLYITARIIEAHGGSIDVMSAEGKGTTFTLTLPFLV